MRSQNKTIEKDYIIKKDKVLGSGSTGSVYAGISKSTKASVAIKIIDMETIDNEVSEYLLKMQRNALMLMKHPNILRCHQVYKQNSHCYIVTEQCNGGTLKDLIQNKGCLSQKKSFEIIEGVLNGYSQCVRKKVLHRDIKPANIMFHDGIPKLIDFGYCTIEGYEQPEVEYNVGSPSYMAPQTYKWNMYNQKTQIWAIGVTFFQCVTGRTLDEGRKMSDIFRQLLQKGLPFSVSMSQKSKKMISWCLEYDPKNRPDCNQLISFLTSIKQPSVSVLESKERKSTYIHRNPSFSILNSSSPSGPANKKVLQQAVRPISNLYESVRPVLSNNLNKYQYILNNNQYLDKTHRVEPNNFKLQMLKDQFVKPQRMLGSMGSSGSTQYFYQKLNCNTFR